MLSGIAILAAALVVGVPLLVLLWALALLIFAFYVWLRPSGPAIDLGPGIDMSVQTLAAMAIVAALFVGYWSLTRHIRLSIDENGITKRSLPPISGARKPRRRIAWSRVLPIAEDASNLYIRSRPSWIGRKFHVTVPKRLFARPDEMERFVQAIEAWREADQTPAGTPDSWPPAPQARK